MKLEEDVFKKYKIIKDKLIDYGFKPKGGKLLYETKLREFNVNITFQGNITGKMFDAVTSEEYTNFRIESSEGYSAEIRDKYIEILTDIRNKCAKKELFQSLQAQKINQYITEKYKDLPEFLWKNFPTYAVYRNPKNNKWYALIGTVQRNKVDKISKSAEIIEVINVKVDKNEIQQLLKQNGIYEAYHMNKKSWISIILDNTLKFSEIEKLIDSSYKNIS